MLKIKISSCWGSLEDPQFGTLQDGFTLKIGNGATSVWCDLWVSKSLLGDQVLAVDIHDTNLTIKDLFMDDVWQLHELYTILPNEVKLDISSLKLHLVDGLSDI